jgi:hypothetical protein
MTTAEETLGIFVGKDNKKNQIDVCKIIFIVVFLVMVLGLVKLFQRGIWFFKLLP